MKGSPTRPRISIWSKFTATASPVGAADRCLPRARGVDSGTGGIPGAGGTQRLTRVVRKTLDMDMALMGRQRSAAEACEAGLVTRAVPDSTELTQLLWRVVGSLLGPFTRRR
ncbi:MAG: hypothetical protein GC186_06050 [Rhodobacteraceae bacterium]|nr:hypothetical protein [Paracoccaceae bacterium]